MELFEIVHIDKIWSTSEQKKKKSDTNNIDDNNADDNHTKQKATKSFERWLEHLKVL